MNQFLDRLLIAARHAGVGETQAAVANSLQLPRQTINRWFKGGMPNATMLRQIAQTWHVNADWLSFGEGQINGNIAAPKDATPDELELLATYRSATSKVKKIILSMAKAARKAA